MSIIPDFTTALYQTKVERFCQLAAGTVVGYEYFITLDYEWNLFWRRRWSIGKVIFIWSRYFGLAFNITNAIVFMQEHPSLDLCLRFFRWQNTGSIVSILTTHFILAMRLYAMYASSKKLLAFFIFLTLAEIGVTIYLFETPVTEAIETNTPLPGISICADADAVHHHFYSYFPTSSLITEAILLFLALYKALGQFRGGYGSIADHLTRDSVRYFIIIFSIYMGVAILWFFNDLTMNESLTGFMFAISIVCANRLLINIRVLYYECETDSHLSQPAEFNHSMSGTHMTSMPRFKTTRSLSIGVVSESIDNSLITSRTTRSALEVQDMQTFSERQGF